MRRYDGYLHRRVEPGRPVIRLTSQSSGVEKVMADSLVDNYKSQHQHPLNRLCHTIGIPLITISWPLFFFRYLAGTVAKRGVLFQLPVPPLANRPSGVQAFVRRTTGVGEVVFRTIASAVAEKSLVLLLFL